MKDRSAGFVFSVPYELAVVRPLRQTTLAEREAALKAASYNTELVAQEVIYIDLSTDSGVSALSTDQLAAQTSAKALEPGMGLAAEGNRAFAALKEQCQAVFGFPFVVPTTQGRSAERIWTKLHVKLGALVAGNMLFPSTRLHVEMNGGKVIDVIGAAAHDLDAQQLFKGDIDLEKLAAVFTEHDGEVACVYVELAVNACGGHPVSLANLKSVKALAASRQVPLFLDACRIFENSYLIKQREPGYQERSLLEIVRETCDLADGMTMSALKDLLVPVGGLIGARDPAIYQKSMMQSFLDGAQPPPSAMEMMATSLKEIFAAESCIAARVEQVNYLWRRLNGGVPLVSPPGGHAVFIDVKKFLPQVAPENHPAEALAAFVYYTSGIRITKGPPPAPSQIERGVDLLRLAVPARKYLQGHMDDVAEALFYAYAHREEIKGLKKADKPGRSKYDPAYFVPA